MWSSFEKAGSVYLESKQPHIDPRPKTSSDKLSENKVTTQL